MKLAVSMHRPLWLFAILTPAFLAPLFAHAYLGTYSRFIADDFCFAARAQAVGILSASAYWYVSWCGRFSANFLDSLWGCLGPRLTPYSCPIVITVWLAVLIFTLRQFIPLAKEPRRFLTSLLLSAMILFTTLNVTPKVSESLYWAQGMRSVVPPLVLGTVIMGFIQYCRTRQAQPSLFWILLTACLTFVAGGFSETYLALQTVLLGGLLAVTGLFKILRSNENNSFRLLVAGFIGSAFSFGIVLLAPGNRVRLMSYPPPPELLYLIQGIALSMIIFVGTIMNSPIKMLSLFGVVVLSSLWGRGYITGNRHKMDGPLNASRALLWIPIGCSLLLGACFAPAVYGTSSYLPARTCIIPTFVLVSALVAWGYTWGQRSYGSDYGKEV